LELAGVDRTPGSSANKIRGDGTFSSGEMILQTTAVAQIAVTYKDVPWTPPQHEATNQSHITESRAAVQHTG